jgi:peptide/nickel transport system permease protein
MSRYFLRRLLLVIPLFLGITMLDYLFINLAPGDPLTAMMDPQSMAVSSPQRIEQLREELGLNKPIPVRYAIWLDQLATGNFGYSIAKKASVISLIQQSLPQTLILTSVALAISIVVGVGLGVISSLKPYSWTDYILTIFAFGGVAVPSFFFGYALMYVFAVRLEILPTSGIVQTGEATTVVQIGQHVILPALTLAYAQIGGLVRFTRSSMLEAIGQDYAVTAQAKGLRLRSVILGHVFKNALLPVITLIGLQLPGLFGGSVIIETVFSWPGIGYLMIGAVRTLDYPLMMGILAVSGTLVLFSNLAADLAYGFADPRIRYE